MKIALSEEQLCMMLINVAKCTPVVQELIALVKQVLVAKAGDLLQRRADLLAAIPEPHLVPLEEQRVAVLWSHEDNPAHLRR